MGRGFIDAGWPLEVGRRKWSGESGWAVMHTAYALGENDETV